MRRSAAQFSLHERVPARVRTLLAEKGEARKQRDEERKKKEEER